MNRLSVFAAGLRDRVRSHVPAHTTSAAATTGQHLRITSGLGFQDVFGPNGTTLHHQRANFNAGNGSSNDNAPPRLAVYPKPLTLRRNMTESSRLQAALMAPSSSSPSSSSSSSSNPSRLSQLRHYFINEGSRRLFFSTWILLHILIFSFGTIHYSLKDNLTTARNSFGWTFSVARSSALVLHVDVAVLLLPVCRNAITLVRRTYLNQLVPFDAK